MASANAGIGIEYSEMLSGQVADEAFGHILSSGPAVSLQVSYRLLGNAADTEDAVQDALLAAYIQLDQFQGAIKDVYLARSHRA